MAADSDPPRDGGCSLLTETSSGRWCVAGALVTVVSGGLFLLLPGYTSVETSDGAASVDVIRGRAMDVPRIRPLLVGLVPIAISITPVLATQRHLRTVLAVSATLLSLYAVLGGASLGLFVAPGRHSAVDGPRVETNVR